MHRKTISITDEMEAFIQQQVASGKFGNDSEFLRLLIRREMERGTDIDRLNRLLDEGVASGVGSRSVDDIFDAARRKAKSGA